MQTYRGNCHCAAFVYEVHLPEIKSASQCNCSICVKKGALWIMPMTDNFKVVKGAEKDLTSYSFGTMQMIHKASRGRRSKKRGVVVLTPA